MPYGDPVPAAPHGGNLAGVAQRYGVDPASLVDFSANVNPFGPAPGVRAALHAAAGAPEQLLAYPEPSSVRLRSALAGRDGVREDEIVVANGSAALVGAVLAALRPACCAVPTPAFSEYARALAIAGAQMLPVPLDAARGFMLDVTAVCEVLARERPELLIVTNPHNPSGALVERSAMEELVSQAGALGTHVLLDEAFIDYASGESLAALAPSTEHLIVLRSLTKFYGMPAMRVGYAVCSARVAGAIAGQLPSWPVSTLALDAAEAALGDTVFESETLRANQAERAYLYEHLTALGVRVTESAANFVLADVSGDAARRDHFCERLVREHGIVVRNCGDYHGLEERAFVRIAVLDRPRNQRLVAAFAALLAS